MRSPLTALTSLLRQALARMGWRLDQSGAGTQIGQVKGNVTIHCQHQTALGPAMPPRVAAPTVQDVLTLLDALPPHKRKAVEAFAQDKFGTTYVKGLKAGQRKTYYRYAYTTLERVRNWGT